MKPLRDLVRQDVHRTAPPVTLPTIHLATIDHDREAREAAERLAERKIIRTGMDAWQAIGKAQTFERWKEIGAALAIGKAHALRATGANRPWGRNYSRAFCDWIQTHHFERMPAPTRSVAIELHENVEAIEAWRDTLPERQRKRLVHPLSVTRRWKQSRTHGNGKCPQDLKRDAIAAWRRFCACVKALPAEDAEPLLQAAMAGLR